MNEPKTNHDELFIGAIRWDDVVITNEAAHFPEPVRPAFIWLKSYTRDALGRDVDRLDEAFRGAGVFHDKAAWSKVLRGRWQSNGKGYVPKHAVLTVESFIGAVEKLQAVVRAEFAVGQIPFVMTTVAQRIFDYIDLRRSVGRANGIGVIVGPTGGQKTATFREYARQRNHGSTRWFEAPENGAMCEFVTRLASDLSAQTASDKKKAHLLKSLHPGKCLIIDNCQDLFRRDGDDHQPAFSYIRRLQDETGCTFILSFTPSGIRLVQQIAGYWEQFEGRSGGSRKWLRLEDYAPRADVAKIAAAFGLKAGKTELDLLEKIAREPGRIRRLFEDLQDATLMAGGAALTIEHVKEARGEA